MKLTRRPSTPLQSLRERADELQAFLDGRQPEIESKIAERKAMLQLQQEAIDAAALELAACRHEAAAAEDDAAKMQLLLKGLIASYEKKIDRALEYAKARLTKVPDAMLALQREKARLRELRAEWRARMRGYADGKVRRKRAELAKLRRRIEEKEQRIRRQQVRGKLTAEEIMFGKTPKDLEVDDA